MFRASFKVGKKLAQSQWEDYSTGSDWIFTSEMGELCLAKRNTYPKTFAFTEGSTLFAGYGDFNAAKAIFDGTFEQLQPEQFYDEEFLLISANIATGEVVIQRDAFITVALFKALDGQSLFISNDYSWTVRHVQQRSVTRLTLSDSLVVLPFNWQDTLAEVSVLTERCRYIVDGHGQRQMLPPGRPRSVRSNPRDFKRVLEDTLDHYWNRYAGQTMAFELSGGLDSSIAPGYFARRYNLQPYCLTKLFPFDFYYTQSQKIADFTRTYDAISVAIPIDIAQHYPLRYILEGGHAAPIYRFTEIYHGINSQLAQAAWQAGASVVFTGIGGNELFERGKWAQQTFAGEAERKRRKAMKPASFYTSTFHELFRNAIEDVADTGVPAPLAASSSLHAGVARNNIYLRKGIWPVSPLANPRLYAFTQGFDARYKDNKNMMRIYAAAAGYPESIYRPIVNEHAGPFFDHGVMAYFPHTAKPIIEQSVLAKHRLVDRHAALSVIDRVKNDSLPDRELFDLYNFVAMEHNLQVLKPEFAL